MIDRHRRVPLVRRHPRDGAAVAGATLCSLIHLALGMSSRGNADHVVLPLSSWFCRVLLCEVVSGCVFCAGRGLVETSWSKLGYVLIPT